MPASKVIALLSGQEDLDRVTREALRPVDPDCDFASDPGAALAAVDEWTRLLVVDRAHPALAAEEVEPRLTAVSGQYPVIVLSLLAPGSDAPAGDAGAATHYVARPLPAETLALLCRALLDLAAEPQETAEVPVVRARHPARFSARPLYGEAVRFVDVALAAARDGKLPDPDEARLLAEKLHTSSMQNNLLLLQALEPYPRFELSTHCVNVAIIAAKIAIGLDLPLAEIPRVIQAGLLHDIGMTCVSEEVLRKEGPLSDEERAEVRQHPVYGSELVAALGEPFEWMRRAIRQEHERLKGQGYPDGLTGDAIDPIAGIIGLADVFEALSHVRHYRSPFTTYEALERVLALRDEQFAPDLVDALADEISVFPLDSYVQLSSGEIARVTSSNPDNILRPVVEVLWNERWEALEEPRRVELSGTPELSIQRPLHESEVPIT